MEGTPGTERDYLCVDAFMRDAVGARALSSAFELGIVDELLSRPASTQAELGARAGTDARGLHLLLGLLNAAGVVEAQGESFSLTGEFRSALRFRDLVEAKLDFAAAVAPDFLDLFTLLLKDPAAFFERAKLFELFSYDRCFDPTAENIAATARWMRFTTALTRYESAACFTNHDFTKHRRMLDVGGNSGEFALQACAAAPGLKATVFDLPLVCDIGERHVRAHPQASRIDFVRATPERGPLPPGADLVTFKSMLHDWPGEPMQAFLDRAHDALQPGGTVLIFERSPVVVDQLPPYPAIPLLLFFRSYRAAEDYRQPLSQAGFVDFEARPVDLDMPFMLVTAKKRANR